MRLALVCLALLSLKVRWLTAGKSMKQVYLPHDWSLTLSSGHGVAKMKMKSLSQIVFAGKCREKIVIKATYKQVAKSQANLEIK